MCKKINMSVAYHCHACSDENVLCTHVQQLHTAACMSRCHVSVLKRQQVFQISLCETCEDFTGQNKTVSFFMHLAEERPMSTIPNPACSFKKNH